MADAPVPPRLQALAALLDEQAGRYRDPATHKIDWLALSAGAGQGEGEAPQEGPAAGEGGEPTPGTGSYRPIEHSTLIELSIGDLAKRIDWPGGG